MNSYRSESGKKRDIAQLVYGTASQEMKSKAIAKGEPTKPLSIQFRNNTNKKHYIKNLLSNQQSIQLSQRKPINDFSQG